MTEQSLVSANQYASTESRGSIEMWNRETLSVFDFCYLHLLQIGPLTDVTLLSVLSGKIGYDLQCDQPGQINTKCSGTKGSASQPTQIRCSSLSPIQIYFTQPPIKRQQNPTLLPYHKEIPSCSLTKLFLDRKVLQSERVFWWDYGYFCLMEEVATCGKAISWKQHELPCYI